MSRTEACVGCALAWTSSSCGKKVLATPVTAKKAELMLMSALVFMYFDGSNVER
jgi:hypothetical protein